MPLWHVTKENNLLLRYLLIENTAAGYKKKYMRFLKKTESYLLQYWYTFVLPGWTDRHIWCMQYILHIFCFRNIIMENCIEIFPYSHYLITFITSKDTLSTVFADNISFHFSMRLMLHYINSKMFYLIQRRIIIFLITLNFQFDLSLTKINNIHLISLVFNLNSIIDSISNICF